LPNWYVLPALLIENESIGLADAAEANAVEATAAVTSAAAILNCLSMMLLWWGSCRGNDPPPTAKVGRMHATCDLPHSRQDR